MFVIWEMCLCVRLSSYLVHAAAAAKSLQSCRTLCNPIDGSPPGSPVPGIFQARTLEWVAISFSNARKWKVKVKSLSRVWLVATRLEPNQAPPSMGFSRQEYWSGLPLPSPRLVLMKFKSKLRHIIVDLSMKSGQRSQKPKSIHCVISFTYIIFRYVYIIFVCIYSQVYNVRNQDFFFFFFYS